MTLLIRHMILNHIQDLQGMRLANTLPKEIIKMDASKKKTNPNFTCSSPPKIRQNPLKKTKQNNKKPSKSVKFHQNESHIHKN